MSKLSARLQEVNLMLAQVADSHPGLGYGVCDLFLLFLAPWNFFLLCYLTKFARYMAT